MRCTVCRGTCISTCDVCVGNSTVPCTVCNGSGHQLVWLTYREQVRCREAEDRVLMAEARVATLAERLRLLDEVSLRGGTKATEAATLARAERLAEIRRLIATDDPDAALAAIDRDFGATWRSDPEISEARADVMKALAFTAIPREGTLARLQRLRVFAAMATKATTITHDREIQEKAK